MIMLEARLMACQNVVKANGPKPNRFKTFCSLPHLINLGKIGGITAVFCWPFLKIWALISISTNKAGTLPFFKSVEKLKISQEMEDELFGVRINYSA
jgi:hypothetical protein